MVEDHEHACDAVESSFLAPHESYQQPKVKQKTNRYSLIQYFIIIIIINFKKNANLVNQQITINLTSFSLLCSHFLRPTLSLTLFNSVGICKSPSLLSICILNWLTSITTRSWICCSITISTVIGWKSWFIFILVS